MSFAKFPSHILTTTMIHSSRELLALHIFCQQVISALKEISTIQSPATLPKLDSSISRAGSHSSITSSTCPTQSHRCVNNHDILLSKGVRRRQPVVVQHSRKHTTQTYWVNVRKCDVNNEMLEVYSTDIIHNLQVLYHDTLITLHGFVVHITLQGITYWLDTTYSMLS